MDSSDVTQLIILGILLLLAAFFSSAEAAFMAVNKLRIRSLAEDEVKGAIIVSQLTENPEKMLSTLLIGNCIVNLSAAAMTTVFVVHRYGNIGVTITVALLILLVLIFCQIMPRTASAIYSEKLTLRYGKIVRFLTFLMTPVIFVINKISFGILLIFHINPQTKASTITEDELRSIVDVSHEKGVIESEERRMITNVVDFGDSLAKDVMVPRVDMAFAESTLSYDELVETFAVDKYTRMPVYMETRDNVIGIVNLKDLFFYNGSKEEFRIEDIMREPYFTYEYKRTSDLLKEMRKESIPIAIVLDEYGATAGLITLEDLVEEIIGEIRDEYDDDEEDAIQSIGENEYIVDGNTNLSEINEVIGLELESDDYDSIAGHMIYLLNHLPEVGETITDNNVVYTVKATEKNHISKVHIALIPETKKETEET